MQRLWIRGCHHNIGHADFGNPKCSGCLNGIINGDGTQANVTCNECGSIIRTVPVVDLQKTLDEMEIGLYLATAILSVLSGREFVPRVHDDGGVRLS
jgi:hypothetical protein